MWQCHQPQSISENLIPPQFYECCVVLREDCVVPWLVSTLLQVTGCRDVAASDDGGETLGSGSIVSSLGMSLRWLCRFGGSQWLTIGCECGLLEVSIVLLAMRHARCLGLCLALQKFRNVTSF